MIYSKRKQLHEEVNALATKYGCKIIRCSLDSEILDIQFKLPETIIEQIDKKFISNTRWNTNDIIGLLYPFEEKEEDNPMFTANYAIKDLERLSQIQQEVYDFIKKELDKGIHFLDIDISKLNKVKEVKKPENKKLTELDIKFERYGFTKINSFYNDSKYAKVIGIIKHEFEITKDEKLNYIKIDVLRNQHIEPLLNLEFFQIEKFEKFLKDREIIDKDFTVIEKETPYEFCPLQFWGFEYNKYGKYFEKDDDIQRALMWQKEDNKKWIFQKYIKADIKKTSPLTIFDLDFKTFKEAESFLFRNGVIKCD